MLWLWLSAALAASLPVDVAAICATADPADIAAVSAWEPMPNRARMLRFRGQPIEDEALLTALMAQRLLEASESEAVRQAIVYHLSGAPGYDPMWSALWSEEPALRYAITGTLKDAGAGALPLLTAGLTDPDPAVRMEAARVAGYRPEPALTAPLLVALSDADGQVRALAARSLGWREDAPAYDALRAGLVDEDPTVRLASLRAMATIDPVATAALSALDALQQDPDSRVARLASELAEP